MPSDIVFLMLKGILKAFLIGTGALVATLWSRRTPQGDVNIKLSAPESDVPIRATLRRTWQDWLLAGVTPVLIALLGVYVSHLSSEQESVLRQLEETRRQEASLLALAPELIDKPAKQRAALGLIWEFGQPCFATQFADWNPSPAAIPAMTRLIREADSSEAANDERPCVEEAKGFLSDFFYSQRTAIFRVRSRGDDVLRSGMILDAQGTGVLAVRPSIRDPEASTWEPIPPQRILEGVGPCDDTGWASIEVQLWEDSPVGAKVRCPPERSDPQASSRALESDDLMWFRLTTGRYTTLTPAALPPVQRDALVLAVNVGPEEPRPVRIGTVSKVTGHALEIDFGGEPVFLPFLFNTEGELIGVKSINLNQYLRIDKLLAYGPEDPRNLSPKSIQPHEKERRRSRAPLDKARLR